MNEHYRYLARYNTWMNGRLYDACEKLPLEERLRDRGAFFGSLHGTLNHILWADKTWLKRFAELPQELLQLPPGALWGTVLHEDWTALRADRHRLDAAIQAWVEAMPPELPQRQLRYTNTKGVERELPMWQVLTHFFNHQTHHRGQATTLLMQAGVDPGVTDMIAMP